MVPFATYIGIGTFTCKPYWNRNMHVQLTSDSGLLRATDAGVGALTCNSHFIRNIYRLGLEHALATYIAVGTFPTYIGVGTFTYNLHWSTETKRDTEGHRETQCSYMSFEFAYLLAVCA